MSFSESDNQLQNVDVQVLMNDILFELEKYLSTPESTPGVPMVNQEAVSLPPIQAPPQNTTGVPFSSTPIPSYQPDGAKRKASTTLGNENRTAAPAVVRNNPSALANGERKRGRPHKNATLPHIPHIPAPPVSASYSSYTPSSFFDPQGYSSVYPASALSSIGTASSTSLNQTTGGNDVAGILADHLRDTPNTTGLFNITQHHPVEFTALPLNLQYQSLAAHSGVQSIQQPQGASVDNTIPPWELNMHNNSQEITTPNLQNSGGVSSTSAQTSRMMPQWELDPRIQRPDAIQPVTANRRRKLASENTQASSSCGAQPASPQPLLPNLPGQLFQCTSEHDFTMVMQSVSTITDLDEGDLMSWLLGSVNQMDAREPTLPQGSITEVEELDSQSGEAPVSEATATPRPVQSNLSIPSASPMLTSVSASSHHPSPVFIHTEIPPAVPRGFWDREFDPEFYDELQEMERQSLPLTPFDPEYRPQDLTNDEFLALIVGL